MKQRLNYTDRLANILRHLDCWKIAAYANELIMKRTI